MRLWTTAVTRPVMMKIPAYAADPAFSQTALPKTQRNSMATSVL
jgi:hypothetical protein